MESYGPFAVRAGILQRSTNFVDLVVRQRSETTGLRLFSARTLSEV